MKEPLYLELLRKSSNKFVKFILGFYSVKFSLERWLDLLNHETVIVSKNYSFDERWVLYHDWQWGGDYHNPKHREISFICYHTNFFNGL